jgi:chromosome segregation protein
MTTTDFKRQLAKSAVKSGAEWLKADFHIHVPGSSDYEYRQSDAFERLGAAISTKGYRFAIILKHEEFPTREEIRQLNQHCPHTTLIPGAEINVFVDALEKKVGKDYYFHCIVAVDPNKEGDYNFILHSAKQQFTYRDTGGYPSGFASSIVDLGKFFHKQGALFIPAHLHQGKSAENSRSIDDVYNDEAFLGFINEKTFDALEVRTAGTAEFFDGKKKTNEGLTIPCMVCIQSTDAHHHEHVAARSKQTWIRAEDATFDELKAALTFRHRVRLEAPRTEHARVLGIHVVGSFIKEAWVPLNEGFNALIGSKGSGKTALVECIRFALNTHIPKDRTDQVLRHLNHSLGPSG